MKKRFLNSVVVVAIVALLPLIGSSHFAAFGQEGEISDQIESGQERNRKDGLVGVWVTHITRRNCTTGEPIAPATQVQLTFAKGGTFLETIVPTVFRSQGNGIWKRAGDRNEYSYALRFMRYDSTGAFIGSGVVRSTLTLDETGDHYTATATNDILDVNGNVIASGCATSVATRFTES